MTAKTRKEIQQAYRDRTNQRLAANGGRVIHLEVYEGTSNDIAYLIDAGGFTDEKEMLTILIRNSARMSKLSPIIKAQKLDL